MRYPPFLPPLALFGWSALAVMTVLNIMDVLGQYRTLNKLSTKPIRPYSKSLHPMFRLRHLTYCVQNTAYVDDDVPAELPGHFDNAALFLDSYDQYSLTSDVQWASLIPKGDGWVRLGQEGRKFAVSLYQQFKCLDAIRDVYVGARDQTKSQEEMVAGFDRADPCFDYLRQMLMCGADFAVEWQIPHTLDTTGEGVLHKCRDWTQVRKAVEKNYEFWEGK
jgi:hypothetical protein